MALAVSPRGGGTLQYGGVHARGNSMHTRTRASECVHACTGLGVAPISRRLNGAVLVSARMGRWMSVLMSLMGVFMSAKMKKRIVLHKKPECWAAVKDTFGAAGTPVGFAQCEGTCKVDPIVDPWKKK